MGNAIKKVANICTDRRQDANPTLDNAVHTGSGKPADPRGDPSAAGRKSGGGAVGGGASDARGGGAGDGGGALLLSKFRAHAARAAIVRVTARVAAALRVDPRRPSLTLGA